MVVQPLNNTCARCNGEFFQSTGDTVYSLDPHIVLSDLPVVHCKCTSSETTIPKISRLHHKIATLLVRKQGRLTGGEFSFLRSHMRVSVEQLAERLNISVRDLLEYERNTTPLPREIDMRCRRVAARRCSLGLPEIDSGLAESVGQSMRAVMTYQNGIWQSVRTS